MDEVGCVVIGAGVVGLAVARALALSGREVLVLEAADMIGTGTSSRNSEVVHAGIYYPTGSMKARLCVAGRDALYAYAAAHGVPHRRCGKLIVATDPSQIDKLDALKAKAEANGVSDLVRLSGEEARAMEPLLACVAALHSPSSGIVDSHALMLAFQGDAEAHGAMVAFHADVAAGEATDRGIVLEVGAGGGEPMRLRCRELVNAAGLHAQDVARRIRGLPPATVPPTHYAKGNYFSLAGRSPFSRLIYPIPEPGGLGVHITIDLGGQARFGPDVEWIDHIDYSVDPRRADGFYGAVRRYWPGLKDGALLPGYAGIRPKLVPAGAPDSDFVIQDARTHGVPGLVNLFGIESPGLTASLAIADAVVATLSGAFAGTPAPVPA
jgi:L-2-hydroxyglutarate oxidase LhgO